MLFDDPGIYDGAFSFRRVILLLAGWMVLWTAWHSLIIGNVAIDVAENIAWGQNFEWGYDKNPYFGAWLSYGVFRLFHGTLGEYVFYFMSQLSAMLGLLAVYLLATDIFKSRFAAFMVVPLALLIPYFSHSSCEFNDDVLSISLYGLTGLFFYRSVRSQSAGEWLAAGFCAGLALMTKYLAGALLLPLLLLLLFTPEGRACWKKPGLYLGGALFCLMILPNLIWLCNHDFIAFKYAIARADLETIPRFGTHILHFLDVWWQYLVLLILPFAALTFLPRGKDPGSSKFDRLFVFAVALGPIILSALFAMITGGKVLRSWLTPYFVFSPLLLVRWYRPVPGSRPLKCFAALVIGVTVLSLAGTVYEYICVRPYHGNSCNHQVYPGRKLSAILTREWRERFAVPCPYVIGKRKDSCFMCYYSPDHPAAFFDHDPKLSPWIDPEDIRRKGAVVIWRGDDKPGYLKQYPDARSMAPIILERQVPAWIRPLLPAPREVIFHAVFIPPSSPDKTVRFPAVILPGMDSHSGEGEGFSCRKFQ